MPARRSWANYAIHTRSPAASQHRGLALGLRPPRHQDRIAWDLELRPRGRGYRAVETQSSTTGPVRNKPGGLTPSCAYSGGGTEMSAR